VGDELRILSSEDVSGSLVTICDITGKQVLSVKLTSDKLDVSRLEPGAYTLVCKKDGKSVTKRFVK
jgi:hypothetical protein